MFAYLERMADLAMQKSLQGLHFWASVYVIFVLLGSLWHVMRVRQWPATQGQLLQLGIRRLGAPDFHPNQQDFVPAARYRYQVGHAVYEGSEISVWKMSASGLLKNTAYALPRQVAADADGKVTVYYNPIHPHKSLLLRPGLYSIAFLSSLISMTVTLYCWRW